MCWLAGLLKVWNLSGLVYSSRSDNATENRPADAVSDSQQVVTSAFYCEALDAVCVTTHEQNIVFYHRDGLKQFKQVSLSTMLLICQNQILIVSMTFLLPLIFILLLHTIYSSPYVLPQVYNFRRFYFTVHIISLFFVSVLL